MLFFFSPECELPCTQKDDTMQHESFLQLQSVQNGSKINHSADTIGPESLHIHLHQVKMQFLNIHESKSPQTIFHSGPEI